MRASKRCLRIFLQYVAAMIVVQEAWEILIEPTPCVELKGRALRHREMTAADQLRVEAAKEAAAADFVKLRRERLADIKSEIVNGSQRIHKLEDIDSRGLEKFVLNLSSWIEAADQHFGAFETNLVKLNAAKEESNLPQETLVIASLVPKLIESVVIADISLESARKANDLRQHSVDMLRECKAYIVLERIGAELASPSNACKVITISLSVAVAIYKAYRGIRRVQFVRVITRLLVCTFPVEFVLCVFVLEVLYRVRYDIPRPTPQQRPAGRPLKVWDLLEAPKFLTSWATYVLASEMILEKYVLPSAVISYDESRGWFLQMSLANWMCYICCLSMHLLYSYGLYRWAYHPADAQHRRKE